MCRRQVLPAPQREEQLLEHWDRHLPLSLSRCIRGRSEPGSFATRHPSPSKSSFFQTPALHKVDASKVMFLCLGVISVDILWMNP